MSLFKLERKYLVENIKKLELKEISILFTKKSTGEERLMKCMYGMRVEKGKGMVYDAEKKGLIVVMDIEKKEYRTIPIVNVKKLIVGDNEYRIVDEIFGKLGR